MLESSVIGQPGIGFSQEHADEARRIGDRTADRCHGCGHVEYAWALLRTHGFGTFLTQNTWSPHVYYSEHMVMVLVAHGRSIVYIISTSYIATVEQYK